MTHLGEQNLPDSLLADFKRIPYKPVRIFHLLHSMFGSEGIKRFYSKDTIRIYRKHLRDAGFDYPVRSVPVGPRQPRVERDLSMGPSKPRRSSSPQGGLACSDLA